MLHNTIEAKINDFYYSGLWPAPVVYIACGINHALALSDEGDVYSLEFTVQQMYLSKIGITYENSGRTQRISQLQRIEQIASNPLTSTSTAKTREGVCWLWGRCNRDFNETLEVHTPTCTNVASLQEAFARFAQFRVTPIIGRSVAEALPTEDFPLDGAASVLSFADAVDDEKFSDFQIVIEGQKIRVHKLILQLRSQYFRTMLDGPWKEAESGEVVITDYSYTTFKHFIDFVYKGTMSASPEEAIDLLSLADCYCEDELKRLCKNIMSRATVVVENAVFFYNAAIKFDMQKLKEKSFRVMFLNLKTIEKTQPFEALAEDIKKEFMDRVLHVGHKNAMLRDQGSIVW